jgi:hypothetical protein
MEVATLMMSRDEHSANQPSSHFGNSMGLLAG